MFSHPGRNYWLTCIIITLVLLCNFSSRDSFAGVCTLPNSGIGGTGLQTDNSGIGGTGDIANGSGIGGTGLQDNNRGIGGTGDIANGSGVGGTGLHDNGSGIGGTGKPGIITGTLTGFGSLCVNGFEIFYQPETLLLINGKKGSTQELAIGQLVSVNVTWFGDKISADQIQIKYAVTGPVSEINSQQNQLKVLNQLILLRPDAPVIDKQGLLTSIEQIQPGDFVSISGLRSLSGLLIASRIKKTEPSNIVSITGPVS